MNITENGIKLPDDCTLREYPAKDARRFRLIHHCKNGKTTETRFGVFDSWTKDEVQALVLDYVRAMYKVDEYSVAPASALSYGMAMCSTQAPGEPIEDAIISFVGLERVIRESDESESARKQ